MESKRDSKKRSAFFVGAAPLRLSRESALLLKKQAKESDLVVAVDGGFEVLKKAGIQPDLYVGDLDSLKSSRLPTQLPAVFLPKEKDCSDLQAALAISMELGVSRFRVWGAWGGRLDHHWAALQELSHLSRVRGVQEVSAWGWDVREGLIVAHWITPGSPLTMQLPPRAQHHAVISLFAVGAPARGVRTRGLQYPLRGEALGLGSRGLSNRANASKIGVSLQSGTLVMMIHLNLPQTPRARR